MKKRSKAMKGHFYFIGIEKVAFVTIHILLIYSNIKGIKCHSPRIDLDFEKKQHVFEGNWKDNESKSLLEEMSDTNVLDQSDYILRYLPCMGMAEMKLWRKEYIKHLFTTLKKRSVENPKLHGQSDSMSTRHVSRRNWVLSSKQLRTHYHRSFPRLY